MLDEKLFKERMMFLSENFNFNASNSFLKMLYFSIKDITSNDEFKKLANLMISKITLEAWNKSYGITGKPAVADWLKMLEKEEEEVKKIVYYKCKITGATLFREEIQNKKQTYEISVRNN